MMWRSVRIPAAIAAAAFAWALPAAAQSGSASTAVTVNVRVVRPCSVATPDVVPGAASGNVEISCGRTASSSRLRPGGTGLVPVAGARAAAAITTRATPNQLNVLVNF